MAPPWLALSGNLNLYFMKTLLKYLDTAASLLQAPFLLIVRLYWGLQFVQTGWGKLSHLSHVAAYFSSLGIPAPHLNAALAGTTEMVGGLLLALGLFSRVVCLPLTFLLGIAYVTAEHAALAGVFSDPDRFTAATPFLFLFAVLTVLAFGPGVLSLDALRGAMGAKKAKA